MTEELLNNKISLDEYNKIKMEIYEKKLESLRVEKIVLTNIECEKCDGVYKYVNYNMLHASRPPQKEVICTVCGDIRFIIV